MKNIVICCDGTGNEISENISNVLKLYRMMRKTEKTTPRQLVFYDPGVGTLARPDAVAKAVAGHHHRVRARHRLRPRRQCAGGLRIPGSQLRRGRRHLSVRIQPRRLHGAGAGGADPQNRSGVAAAGQSRRLRPHLLQAVQLRGAGHARWRPGNSPMAATLSTPAPPPATTRRRNSRASFPPDGPPSNSSGCGTRWRASSCRARTGSICRAC